MSKITEALREARIQAGFSQRAVAKALGISPAFLNDLEHHRRNLNDSYLPKLPVEMREHVRLAFISEYELAIERLAE